ncbi:MAG: DUF1592 domain-containing protein [Myxococcales bacterium]|nr:DUF1592 domain-containing protein [Myxococcales bacterium]
MGSAAWGYARRATRGAFLVQSLSIARLSLLFLLAACAGEVSSEAGPDSQGPPGSDGEAACESQRAYFARQVWTPVLDRICIDCHAPDGVATAQNAALLLVPSAYPGFLDANIENLTTVAKLEFDGTSVLLRKPLGEMSHGGGPVLSKDSDEYAALATFVERLSDGGFCEDEPAPNWDDVEQLDAHGTYRKATLQLAGRLPSARELERLDERGEQALPDLIDGLLEEEAFSDRLKDIYNDRFLTDFYLRYNSAAVNLFNRDDYPNRSGDYYDMLDADVRDKANRALAREPLELIAYIVDNDRPFSEMLTADYTVVNPYSALLYDVQVDFEDPNDERDFVPAQIVVRRDDGDFEIPHAGVLTTPVVLNRMPTTATNRNRHRARRILELFLATDVLRIATRPIDPEASSQFNNPTRDDPQCTGCHRQIDPIAGSFLKWDERDQERYFPEREWHPEMFPPGFGTEIMDKGEYDRAQAWLAERIVRDPRFVLSVVHTVYRGITGREPLLYPQDSMAEDFAEQRAAFNTQDATFRTVGDAFVADDMNLKTVVRELVLTPYFRAHNASADGLEPARRMELAKLGTARFSIPSVLARKIRAVTGVRWARNQESADYLSNDYRVLYGGIDSDSVTERLTVPNGIMANLAQRMANEVACFATARDFALGAEDRLLFPHVGPADLPKTLNGGDDVPAAVTRIKQNIQHLHERVLGERLAEGDPELERTYQLFLETWQEGVDKVQRDEVDNSLPRACQARTDPNSGEELGEEQRLITDEGYAVRAWMAVVTYLLSDYKFLYE